MFGKIIQRENLEKSTKNSLHESDWGNLSGKDPNVEIVKALDHASYKKMLEAVLMMQ